MTEPQAEPSPPHEIVVKLSAEERRLILKYGYPSPRLERDLEALAKDGRARLVAIAAHELSFLIGDLSHSTNHASSSRLAEALDEISVLLELEERRLPRATR